MTLIGPWKLLFVALAVPGGPLVAAAEIDTKRVLFIAGAPSHGFGNHEHRGGSTLLAETINRAGVGVQAEVVSGRLEAPEAFDGVDAVVIFSNGGSGHPVSGHLEEFRRVMDRGVGLVCLHYAVEVPKGPAGEAFLEWLGGFFELHWSVNPFWTPRFDPLPEHPITRGVRPFEIRDEWYYHMRFVEDMAGVTPILTDLPPKESLTRPDGPHSNNPHVREAVLQRREPQHMAWAYERPGGGRGFGFTGGHVHWNWGLDDFRRLVANAVVWAAGGEVPEGGVPFETVTVLELGELTDDPVPADWDHREIQRRLDELNERAGAAR